MANFESAFNFQLFFSPVTAASVDTGSVTGGISKTTGGFINYGSLVADNGTITEGVTPDRILLAGETVTKGAKNVAGTSSISAYSVFELLGLTDASLDSATKSEEVVTYGDSGGYSQGVATSKSWKISIEGVTDFNSAAYQAMRLLEKNNVAGGLRCKIGRLTPSGEAVYGYATLKGFKEKSKAGSIVAYSVEAEGYGPLGLTLA
jgi:hypothetical protein